jgi:hypothetical protein
MAKKMHRAISFSFHAHFFFSKSSRSSNKKTFLVAALSIGGTVCVLGGISTTHQSFT